VRRRVVAFALATGLMAVVSPSTSQGADPPKGPRISAEPLVFDFGKVLSQKTLHKDFVIRNVGTEDLDIERVSTTCGCTVAEEPPKVVKPGQSAILKIKFETRTYSGRVERKILVQSNDPVKNPLELRIQATVVAEQ
jgi:Protein of unknown function (DUF1573)